MELTSDHAKAIIIVAPSGSGKSTLVKKLLENIPNLSFSISATTRKPRHNEIHGEHYYFLSEENFKRKIENEEMLEWREVYQGKFYGTLKEEVDRIFTLKSPVIFDVDVNGGLSLKNYFKDCALSIFIKTESIEELRKRLLIRKADHLEEIEERLKLAELELRKENLFDTSVVNDNLEIATSKIVCQVKKFLRK